MGCGGRKYFLFPWDSTSLVKGIVWLYLDLFQLQLDILKWGYYFHITPWVLSNHNELALVKNPTQNLPGLQGSPDSHCPTWGDKTCLRVA